MIDYDDEYSGQGGSYVIDPATGQRTLVERTMEQSQEQPQAPAAEQPTPSEGEVW